MANLYRVVLLWLVLCGSAFAAFPVPPGSEYSANSCLLNSNAVIGWYPSPSAACGASASQYPGQAGNVNSSNVTGTGPYVCTWSQSKPGTCYSGKTYTVGTRPLTCPANSTLVTGQCVCNAGFMEDGTPANSCKPVPVCPAGQSNEPLANNACMPVCTLPQVRSVGQGGVFNGCLIPAGSTAAKCANAKGSTENYYSTPAPAASNNICATLGPNAGCSIDVSWTASATVGGVKTLYGTGVVGGKTCTDAAAENAAAVPPKLPPIDSDKPGAPAPTPCKPGTFPGTVNGVSVCVPPTGDKPVSTEDTTKKTNPDGSTTETKKETECTGASCTTKTTETTTPSGGVSSTTTTTTESKPQKAFCEENPNLAICKTGSFAGSCSAGFSCDGDALQCSIAREQHTRNCQMFDKSLPESELYDTEKVKTGDQTATLPGNTSVALSGASFSQAPIFASQGLSDLSITVAGNSVSIEMTRLNQWLEILGLIAVAVTSLVCVRVVFGAA